MADEAFIKHSDTDKVLAVKARSGDMAAFQQLIDRYQSAIHRMLFYRTRSNPDAEDLTQETFIKAFQHIQKLKRAEQFKSWLYRIAMNCFLDFFRKKRLRAFFFAGESEGRDSNGPLEDSSLPEALKAIYKKEFWEKVGIFLDTLPKNEREAFLLRFFDGLDIKEISCVMKKKESTVKTHLYRAIGKFKRASHQLDLPSPEEYL